MMLYILRGSNMLFQTEEIINFNIDGVSLSSIDYWSQEARKATITTFYTKELKNILEGTDSNIIFGFHTLEFHISHNNKTLFIGVLPIGSFTIEYLTPSSQTIEFNLIDFLGLLLQLADNHTFHLGHLTHPVNIIPQIIASCFMNNQNNDNSNPPLVRQLRAALPALSWTNAATSYNQGIWLPFSVSNYVIYDYHNDYINANHNIPLVKNDIIFGLYVLNDSYYIYFSQHLRFYKIRPPQYYEYFRYRIYKIYMNNITLIDQEDLYSDDINNPISIPLPPFDLANYIYGIGNYAIQNNKVIYSGPFLLDNIQTNEDDYNASELLSEFLLLSHAVLLNLNGSFKIINRIDPTHPYLIISDPISASFNESEPSDQPDINSAALYNTSISDSVNRYYKNFLSNNGLNQIAEIVIIDNQLSSLYSPDNLPIPSNPYELINFIFIFDNHYIYPKQIDYDLASGKITITGWAGPFIQNPI